MRTDSRWLVTFGGSFVFLFVIGQANHHLAHTPFTHGPAYLFLLGLPVTFAALRLSLGQGFAATIATAALAEAGLPLTYGVFMIPAIAAFCITFALRSNFNRLNLTSAIIAALAVNAALMIVLTLVTRPFHGSGAWARLVTDFTLSQLVLAAFTSWFFAAQLALLRLFGFSPETELREAP